MKRSLVGAVVTLLLLAAPVAALAGKGKGKPPKPGGPNQVTLGATPNLLTFGLAVTVSGDVKGNGNAGVKVNLQADPFPTGAFAQEATATTDSRGNYRFVVRPPRNTRYFVVAKTSPDSISPTATVNVRTRVVLSLSDRTPKRGQKVRFFGTVTPAHDGAPAKIQRRTASGSYLTLVTVPLVDNGNVSSRFSRSLRIYRDGVYRVLVPADSDHAAGRSPRRSIDVHS